ncbi:nucleotide-diphospho-sugar transferase [Gorgonomyces haynaldii]|nr:nucleotide-diphospho-sugar transferase [Gorgonomyces haynaldii]
MEAATENLTCMMAAVYLRKSKRFLVLLLFVAFAAFSFYWLEREPIVIEHQVLVNQGPKQRVAYAFFATEERYLCAATVNAAQLLELNTRSDADIVLVHTPSVDPTKFLKLNRTRAVSVEPWTTSHFNSYYADVFMKFAVFDLIEYDKIIYFDADSLVTKNLDHLFLLPQAELAAPRMYWGGDASQFTSALLVLSPSKEQFELLKSQSIHFSSKTTDNGDTYYDMDVLNVLYRQRLLMLPPQYLCLNSHWEVKSVHPFPVKSLKELEDHCLLIHFTALGKPWTWTAQRAREAKPDADPYFYELFGKWHIKANKYC